MTSQQEKKFDVSSLFLYVLGFLLLSEWLRPVEQLTDTANIGVFVIFLIVSFALSYFKVNIFLGTFIKVLYILYALQNLYLQGSFFGFGWIGELISVFQRNIASVFDADWTNLSDLFRSFLFFVLLWLMTYLIQYWLINRRQIFIFFFMTLVYVTVLDTFTPYEADHAIVRTVICGFAIMGMLTFYRIIDKEKIKKEFSFSKRWMIPLATMIGLSVIVGYAAPKADPIWPDPVPYIKSYSKDSGTGGSSVSKVGYGTDDSRLGGPFIGDNEIVFRAEVDSRHYWRIETKDVYTGKGWVESQIGEERVPFTQDQPVPFSNLTGEAIETEERISSVFAFSQYPHLIYPLGLKKVQADANYTFEVDSAIEKIYSLDRTSVSPLEEYHLTFDSPRFSVTAMKAGDQNPIDTALLQQYTQLPENLPQRVKDLALEITEGEETLFDKARAVERYFGRNEYAYDQQNVAVPGMNDDYVDQFLFETKRGYCDNFSSSMVVLLRSVGVPARWVKGYTEGEYSGVAPSGKRFFNITNNNAHSWVEVYFEGVGWVPFEPTQGFSNNVQFNFDETTTSTNTETPEQEEQPEQEKPENAEETDQTSSSSFSFEKLFNSMKEFFVKHWGKILIYLALIGLAGFILYKLRLKWLPRLILLRFKLLKKDEDFVKAYLVLLKQLDRYGLKRKNNQTLREYARYIDHFFSSREMGRLTSRYERYLYNGHLEEGSWKESKELWENLIKKTIA
ncbi:DUF4129 domain-containing transglutaminase family protein [Cytobacillus sp. FJAT-54145]|uniref:DUF4129 domain-containing transglutaminase family protein n=1 Tax=Cytobacillus spartinae TaxID=3299023 RepID=A0ABW6KLA1_9BACI